MYRLMYITLKHNQERDEDKRFDQKIYVSHYLRGIIGATVPDIESQQDDILQYIEYAVFDAENLIQASQHRGYVLIALDFASIAVKTVKDTDKKAKINKRIDACDEKLFGHKL